MDKPKKKRNRSKKKGLRTPQARILRALLNAREPWTQPQVAKASNNNEGLLYTYLGSPDPAVRERTDAKYCVSLVTLKLVRTVAIPSDDGYDFELTGYEITAAGRKALAKYEEEQATKKVRKKPVTQTSGAAASS